MKIEKYSETYEGDGGDDFLIPSDYTVGFTQDRIFIRTLNKNTYLVITLEPKDILKLMTWLIGQEEHQRRNTVRSDKDNENQKMVDTDILQYTILKKDVKSLELQLHQDGENISIEAVHMLQDTIKQHYRDLTHLEIKFKYCTGRDIPYKEK